MEFLDLKTSGNECISLQEWLDKRIFTTVSQQWKSVSVFYLFFYGYFDFLNFGWHVSLAFVLYHLGSFM